MGLRRMKLWRSISWLLLVLLVLVGFGSSVGLARPKAKAAGIGDGVEELERVSPKGLGEPGTLETLAFERGSLAGEDEVLSGGDARRQLALTGSYSSGQQRDLTRAATYTVSAPDIVTIDPNGFLVPLDNGEAEIVATVGAGVDVVETRLRVRVGDFHTPVRVNFPNRVVPIFTKLGCNSGGCHGKSGGQNNFRLSLLGFYPKDDHEFLVKESRGRRMFSASPDRSLLLLKATNELAHGGGARLSVDSDEYRVIRRWMLQGMPYGKPTDPIVKHIEVIPGSRIMDLSSSQQLRVLAHYSDGSAEDVTRTAQFESNMKEMAEASETGLVHSADLAGDVAIMVRYQSQVTVFRATIPLGAEVAQLPPVNNFVDEHVFAKLKALGIPPSGLCDDVTFLRRVTIDIVGRVPSATEVEDYLKSEDPKKREATIDRLLASTDYAEYFANKWSAILRNKNVNRKSGSFTRGTYAFYEWIRESLHTNKPYDDFVGSIVAASGKVTENPAVVWYRSVKKVEEQVEDSAQLFLGQRIQCARCHHHPFERWSQKDYYSFSAFFSQVGRKNGPDNRADEPRIFHRRGEAKAVNPRTGESLRPAGLGSAPLELAPDEDPRVALVAWQRDAKNPYFAASLVNRYWKHFFSRGIVEPEDDMRVTNPPSHPELLDALARHFRDSGFDLKDLVRVICTSSTYQLSSIPNLHNQRDRQNYSRYYPKRLAAEVLYDSIHSLCGSSPAFNGVPVGTRAVALPDTAIESYFLTVFGRPSSDSSCECERSQEANLAQSLHLMNSKQIQEQIAADSSRAALLAKDEKRSLEEKIAELTLWAFGRRPNTNEIQIAREHISKKEKKNEAFEDIVWAFLNTKEFLFNH